jgi:hypothetical protein
MILRKGPEMRSILAIIICVCLSAPAMALDWPDNHTRTVILENRCSEAMKIIVTHSPTRDVWEKAGWFTMQPGERNFPFHEGKRLQHRDNATLLLYARSVDDSFEVKGDHGTNFAGEHYKSFKVSRIFRGKYVDIRLNCD